MCALSVRGFDVLRVKVSACHVLCPSRGHNVVSEILTFLTSTTRCTQPILVHGFSVGGYLYGLTLIHIESDTDLAAAMSQRIRGQVFDSPVDFDGVPRGVGVALTNLRPLQVICVYLLEYWNNSD